MYVAMSIFVLAIAFIPKQVWAQGTQTITSEVIRMNYCWPDSLKGQYMNVWSALVYKDTIFIGTSYGSDGRSGVLLTSPDSGRTWRQIGKGKGLDIGLRGI